MRTARPLVTRDIGCKQALHRDRHPPLDQSTKNQTDNGAAKTGGDTGGAGAESGFRARIGAGLSSLRGIAPRIVNPRPLIAIAALALGIGGFVLLMATQEEIEPRPAEERVWTVSVTEVAAADIQPELRLYGTVVAGQDVDVRPLVAGRVVELGENFAEGGIVEQGELLARIDPFDYQAAVAEADAQLTEARARLAELRADLSSQRTLLPIDREQTELREREVERRERLRARGSGSQKAVDDARIVLNEQRQRMEERAARIATLETRVEQQQAAVRRAVVALERARRNLVDTEVRASVTGFLRDINVAVGQRVGTNERIARLVDARWLEAVFQVSDDQYARLVAADNGGGTAEEGERQGGTAQRLTGRPVRVIWRTATENLVFEAEIDRIAGAIASDSGGINLRARLRGTGVDTPLRPGAFVEIRIKDRLYRDVFRIPDTAVQDDRRVYRLVDARLEAREIRVVGRDGGSLLVRGALEDGDRIVTNIFPAIGPGLKVQIR